MVFDIQEYLLLLFDKSRKSSVEILGSVFSKYFLFYMFELFVDGNHVYVLMLY